MSAAGTVLAEVSTAGEVQVHKGGESASERARVSLSLVAGEGGADLHVGRSASTHGESVVYVVPADALREAVQALPLKQLLRIVREARA